MTINSVQTDDRPPPPLMERGLWVRIVGKDWPYNSPIKAFIEKKNAKQSLKKESQRCYKNGTVLERGGEPRGRTESS